VGLANATGGAIFMRGGGVGGTYAINNCNFTANTVLNSTNTIGGASACSQNRVERV
jgi:hypothetical protein